MHDIFCNPQFPRSELTQEMAIQREKNAQFVFGIHHQATAKDIDGVVFPSRLEDSFWQFKSLALSGKPVLIVIQINLNGIRICVSTNPVVIIIWNGTIR
jgi:hypothetical protein